MPRAEKEAKVREIAGELEGSQAAILAGYRGLTVQEAAELRGALLEVDTRFSVVKNSLAMLAVKEAGHEDLVAFFDGPTALAFVKGDPVPAARRLVEQVKKFPVIEIRGGFAEGRVLSAEEIRTLAALDSREVMLAKIAGLGKMQMSKAAWMFQALQSKFLLLLQALKEKLPPEEGEAEAADGGRLSEAAEESSTEESTATEEPAADAEAASDGPAAEDNPDAEQPAGGDEAEQSTEGPDETPTGETETEPEAPGGPPSEETEGETEEGGS
jgi:large subunit ribosomal protein L10